jgi:hypothetical protein
VLIAARPSDCRMGRYAVAFQSVARHVTQALF